jgi:hypothetical protein
MCEYCKLPDFLGFAAFEVDHIIARAHQGSSNLDNLAWACLFCNVKKGPNIASIDPATGKTIRLFHPRRNRWSSHFRLSEGLVIAKTSAGRATLSLLQMNQPQTFSLRRALEQVDSKYALRASMRCM